MKTMSKKRDSTSRHKYKAIGLRLDEAKRQEVTDMALAERRSLAQMCAILVEEALEARKKRK
jgi:hypothetical protein